MGTLARHLNGRKEDMRNKGQLHPPPPPSQYDKLRAKNTEQKFQQKKLEVGRYHTLLLVRIQTAPTLSSMSTHVEYCREGMHIIIP